MAFHRRVLPLGNSSKKDRGELTIQKFQIRGHLVKASEISRVNTNTNTNRISRGYQEIKKCGISRDFLLAPQNF